MIEVSVNNEKKSFEEGVTVQQLLEQCGYHCEKVAVAINAEFVPRSSYATCEVKLNDELDILAPVQGG